MTSTALVFVLGICLIIGAIILAIVLNRGHKNSNHPPAPPLPGCGGRRIGRLTDPGEFYSITSNGGQSGRDDDGNYIVNGKTIEKGIGDAASMGASDVLLTYAHGHPFYGSGGGLTGKCWDDHARGFAPSYKRCGYESDPTKVLVIENGTKLCLDTDAAFEGLVVRHGGQVLVAGTVTLRVQFLLIESGGLFQAGSSYDDNFRFDGQLTILLVHSDDGYATMGCPASQYSYQVYSPGVTKDPLPGTNNPTFAPYTGMTTIWNNTFGPKSVCVGFNGNYHLAGQVPPKEPYSETWNAWDQSGQPIFNSSDRLSVGSPYLPSSYPVTWVPLVPGQYKKGESVIKVRSKNVVWWQGKEVVILACPRQYTTDTPKNPTGLLPVWINNKDVAQQKANADATTKFLKTWTPAASIGGPDDGIPGVEVQRVKSVGPDGTLTLEAPLQFDHSCGAKTLTRSYGPSGKQTIQVDCPVHVGVLTRNILVTSELRAGGSGCNVLFDKNSLTSMLPGRAGQSMPNILKASGMVEHAEHLEKLEASAPAPRGPGGSVVCNTDGQNPNPNLPIFDNCYKNVPYDPTVFCGNEQPIPADQVEGHWLWGTSGLKGCGTIHGGQQLFKYGAAICVDSAEVKYLGTPGNFGTLGQYCFHFHLTGYAKSFTGYLPNGSKYPRDLVVRNSAIWCSMSRWITVHGATELEISNNVGFMTFGSGYFVEDGVELYNTFDHNLGAYAIPAVQSDYLNSPPIYPNVSSDFAQMSVFWFKNNGNVVARNVAACCPAPVIGYWMVPQPIGPLRGPSSVVLGSEPLKLPGLQSMGNAIKLEANNRWALSQSNNSNKDGSLKSVAGDTTKTPCWVPDDFVYPLARVKQDRCIANTNDNSEIPYMGFMENVAYAIFMYMGEMPEMLADGGIKFNLSVSGVAIGVGAQLQDNKARAQWLPINGQSACTDKLISTYPETKWASELPYQPLSDAEISGASNATWNQSVNARSMPKIISGALAFCLGPFQNLWGGTAWLKQMATWLLNCAFIDTADDNTKWGGLTCPNAYSQPPNNIFPPSSTKTSTIFIQGSGDGVCPYYGTYAIAHNFISNGFVSIVPNPALWTGSKTFYDDRCVFMHGGEEPYTINVCTGVNKIFCDFGSLSFEDAIPNPFHFGINASAASGIYLYDMTKQRLATLDMSTGAWKANPQAFPPGGNQTKFPFICKDQRLRRASDGADPDFLSQHGFSDDVVANYLLKHFCTKDAQQLGDAICKNLYAIPANLGPKGWPGTKCSSKSSCPGPK